MDFILPICDICRKTERGFLSSICYAQKPLTILQNDPPIAQNHYLKMMTQHSKKCHISKNEPHLAGEFWLPSQSPNEIPKITLQILGSLDVDRLFECGKWPPQGWETWFFGHFLHMTGVPISGFRVSGFWVSCLQELCHARNPESRNRDGIN